MHKESYPYRCQITGKVKAYKKMSDQVARALNWTLAEQGSYGRWVVQALSDEARQVAAAEQQSTKTKLLQPNGPMPSLLPGVQQNTVTYPEEKAS